MQRQHLFVVGGNVDDDVDVVVDRENSSHSALDVIRRRRRKLVDDKRFGFRLRETGAT